MNGEFAKIKEMQARRVACGCDLLPEEPKECNPVMEKVCFSPCAAAIRVANMCYCFCDCGCGSVHLKANLAYRLQRLNCGRVVDSANCEVMAENCGGCSSCEDPCEEEPVVEGLAVA